MFILLHSFSGCTLCLHLEMRPHDLSMYDGPWKEVALEQKRGGDTVIGIRDIGVKNNREEGDGAKKYRDMGYQEKLGIREMSINPM